MTSTVSPPQLATVPHLVEAGVLVLANLAATVLRFLLLRAWVFRHSARGRLVEPAVPEPEEA